MSLLPFILIIFLRIHSATSQQCTNCLEYPTVPGGYISYYYYSGTPSFYNGTTLNIYCDFDHSLIGNPYVVCINASWAFLGSCAPTACYSSPPLTNSYCYSWNYIDNSPVYANGSFCYQECPHSLGSQSTICVNGSWTALQNICSYSTDCFGEPNNVENAYWSCPYDTDYYVHTNGTLCSAQCSYNTVPLGNPTDAVQCLNGTWVPQHDFTCYQSYCYYNPSLPNVDYNGYYYYESNGTVVYGQCNEGYKAVNATDNFGQICANGDWQRLDAGVCVADDVCLTFPYFPPGSQIAYCFNSYNYPYLNGTFCYGYCANSYSYSLSTQCDGYQWTAVNGFCPVNLCGYPPALANSYSCNSYYYNNPPSCSFGCLPGYTPSLGTFFDTICDPDTGSWTPLAGTCSPNSCSSDTFITLFSPPGAVVSEDCDPNAASGTVCDILCLPGYTANPDQSAFVLCSAGTWEYSGYYNLICIPDCAELPSLPANVVAGTCRTNFTAGASCVTACAPGYEPSPGYLPDSFTMACYKGWYNSYWSGISASCVLGHPNRCLTYPCLVGNNMTFGNCLSNSSSGAVCTPACEDGYFPSANLSVVCLSGVWSLPQGVCSQNPNICAGAPTLASNSAFDGICPENAPFGTTCNAVCAPGYTSNGFLLQYLCTSSGQWASPTRPCTPFVCVTTPLVLTPYSIGTCTNNAPYGTVCRLGCGNSHTLVGSLTVLCENGQWTEPVGDGQCESNCITMPSFPSNLLHGSCQLNLASRSTCMATCDEGHALAGGSLLTTCMDGEWIYPHNYSCVPSSDPPCTYPLYLNPYQGVVSNTCPIIGTQFSAGSSCTLGCVENTALISGSLNVTCQSGQWNVSASCSLFCNASLSNLPAFPNAIVGTCDLSVPYLASQNCTMGCADNHNPTRDLTVVCEGTQWQLAINTSTAPPIVPSELCKAVSHPQSQSPRPTNVAESHTNAIIAGVVVGVGVPLLIAAYFLYQKCIVGTLSNKVVPLYAL